MTKPKNHEFEPADYVGLHLTSHPTKSSADIQFVRPDRTALTVTIPALTRAAGTPELVDWSHLPPV